jgi:transcriptional regulator with XRE-family HTH domain
MLNKIIGENVKTLRESFGFSQTNIADFLHVNESFITEVENGERSLSTEMLEKVTSLFCVTVEDIQKPQIKVPKVAIAIPSDELTAHDMEAISAVTKIALRSKFMSDLSKKNN